MDQSLKNIVVHALIGRMADPECLSDRPVLITSIFFVGVSALVAAVVSLADFWAKQNPSHPELLP
jgi:hypothetical protein